MKCNLCPNNCNVDRTVAKGKCRVGDEMRIARIAPHFYEEPVISGTRGSGTVFFCGCGMGCKFCQNYEISRGEGGKAFTPTELAEEIKKLAESGVHNINFVTPTHFADKISDTLNIFRPTVPIVYNTSGYEKAEIIDYLNSYVDIYLTDFKYADNAVGKKYSNVSDYADRCVEATDKMVSAKPIIMQDGMLKQGVIVRHLVLPGELDNTLKTIALFAERWKGRAILSLMSQFFPTPDSPIRRKLKPVEYKIAVNKALELVIDDCFIQELSSADIGYVPDFGSLE